MTKPPDQQADPGARELSVKLPSDFFVQPWQPPLSMTTTRPTRTKTLMLSNTATKTAMTLMNEKSAAGLN